MSECFFGKGREEMFEVLGEEGVDYVLGEEGKMIESRSVLWY